MDHSLGTVNVAPPGVARGVSPDTRSGALLSCALVDGLDEGSACRRGVVWNNEAKTARGTRAERKRFMRSTSAKTWEIGTNNSAPKRTCKTAQAADRTTDLSFHNSATVAASVIPQMANAMSTTQRGAAPTRRSKNGRKFHIVMCT